MMSGKQMLKRHQPNINKLLACSLLLGWDVSFLFQDLATCGKEKLGEVEPLIGGRVDPGNEAAVDQGEMQPVLCLCSRSGRSRACRSA